MCAGEIAEGVFWQARRATVEGMKSHVKGNVCRERGLCVKVNCASCINIALTAGFVRTVKKLQNCLFGLSKVVAVG